MNWKERLAAAAMLISLGGILYAGIGTATAEGLLAKTATHLESAANAQGLDPAEDAAFQALKENPSVPAIREFLRQYPLGQHRDEANKLLEEHRELLAWEAADEKNTREGYETYIELYPTGEFIEEAKRRIAELRKSPSFIIHPETALEGLVTSQPDAPSPNQCNSACAADSSCKGYSFSYETKACNLYADVTEGRRRDQYTAGTLEQIQIVESMPAPLPDPETSEQEAEQFPRSQSTFVELRGIDLPGRDADLGMYPAASHAGCQDLCRADPRCRAYTYNTANNVCFTKSRAMEFLPHPDAHSGHLPDDPLPEQVKPARSPGDKCDELAANPYDLQRPRELPGVKFSILTLNADEAAESCETALAQDPKNLRYAYQLGRALHSKNLDAAIRHYAKATIGNYAAAFDNLGWSLIKKDKRAEGEAILLQGANLGDPSCMYSLAYIAEREAKGNIRPNRHVIDLYRQAAQLRHAEARQRLQEISEEETARAQDAERRRREQAEAAGILLDFIGGIVRSY